MSTRTNRRSTSARKAFDTVRTYLQFRKGDPLKFLGGGRCSSLTEALQIKRAGLSKKSKVIILLRGGKKTFQSCNPRQSACLWDALQKFCVNFASYQALKEDFTVQKAPEVRLIDKTDILSIVLIWM